MIVILVPCDPVAIEYVSETWEQLRTTEQNLLERTGMRLLRWMMGIKRIEKIRNEEIRARAGMAQRGLGLMYRVRVMVEVEVSKLLVSNINPTQS